MLHGYPLAAPCSHCNSLSCDNSAFWPGSHLVHPFKDYKVQEDIYPNAITGKVFSPSLGSVLLLHWLAGESRPIRYTRFQPRDTITSNPGPQSLPRRCFPGLLLTKPPCLLFPGSGFPLELTLFPMTTSLLLASCQTSYSRTGSESLLSSCTSSLSLVTSLIPGSYGRLFPLQPHSTLSFLALCWPSPFIGGL